MWCVVHSFVRGTQPNMVTQFTYEQLLLSYHASFEVEGAAEGDQYGRHHQGSCTCED